MTDLALAALLFLPSVALIAWAVWQERKRHHKRTDGKGEA